MSASPLATGWMVAFDTSTRHGSTALGRHGGPLVESDLGEGAEQASGIVPAIESLLRKAEVGAVELGGVVVGGGPGSFTGVRVAAATAKGLCAALGIPLWAVSSLEAAAYATDGPVDGTRFVLFDARGDRLYAAGYRPGTGDALQIVQTPIATTVDDLLVMWATGRPTVLMGDGALRHRRRFEAAGLRVADDPSGRPRAANLLRAVWRTDGRRSVPDPTSWAPDYLRPSSAETLREP